jgi:hypothetical protein
LRAPVSAPDTVTQGPLISVILPVHDGERFLAAALGSILQQTYRHFELIVIDDGSTDGSAALVASYADPRVRLVRNGCNLGLVATLNRGLDLARGEFIARMDADDVALPERLALQVQRMLTEPELAVLGTDISYVDDVGLQVRLPRALPRGPALVRWRLLRGNCLYHPSAMIRRSALGAERYSTEFVHAEDYELWLRLCRRHRLDNLPGRLLRHRRHGSSVSGRYPDTQLDSAARALRDHVQVGYGLPLTPGQARSLLDPRAFLGSHIGPQDSPVPVVLELERSFLSLETDAAQAEVQAVRRDVAFIFWKLAALSLVHWPDGLLPMRRLRLLLACAGVLLRRPGAAVAALWG